eukprot:g24392.t1
MEKVLKVLLLKGQLQQSNHNGQQSMRSSNLQLQVLRRRRSPNQRCRRSPTPRALVHRAPRGVRQDLATESDDETMQAKAAHHATGVARRRPLRNQCLVPPLETLGAGTMPWA